MIVDHAKSDQSPPAPPQTSQDDLAQIITAYNQVTERLQQSHETLQQEVLRLRQELASTNAQLQRSKRLSALGEMAAGIAHEIRNPLTAIQLYAGMALEDLPENQADGKADGQGDEESPSISTQVESARDSTEKIASAVRGLSGIVNDVLSFARQIQPNARTVRISEIFSRLINAHRPAINEARIDLSIEVDDDCQPTLDVDPDLLHQALLNLVRNAVDVMASSVVSTRGRIKPDNTRAHGNDQTASGVTDSDAQGTSHVLTLAARTAEDGSTTLQIRDTGPGIDDEHVDRIFNPFFTTRNTGTGLGLAIVHRIIDAHNASIRVWNDGGAVFEMTFAPTSNLQSDQQSDCDADALRPASDTESPSPYPIHTFSPQTMASQPRQVAV